MKGNLLLVKNYTWIGSKIRKSIGSEFNHIGIFVNDNEVVEATFLGVKKNNIKKFNDLRDNKLLDYEIYQWIDEIPKEAIDYLVERVLEQVGCSYDFWQLLSIALFLFLNISRKVEPIEVNNKWVCSELIGELAFEIGIRFNENVDPDNITPADILNSGLIKKIKN